MVVSNESLNKRQTFYKNFRMHDQYVKGMKTLLPIDGPLNMAYGGMLGFFGLWMNQNQNALVLYDTIFKHFISQEEILPEHPPIECGGTYNIPELAGANKIGRIIEIGSLFGGLSILFNMFAKCYGCDFIGYDICGSPYHEEMEKFDINMRKMDVFQDEERLGKEIASEGVTILLCDGGNKIKEFNMFSKYLKSGDVILAHDYAPDYEFYTRHIQGKIWNACEITYPNIQESVETYNLKPFFYELGLISATACFIKE